MGTSTHRMTLAATVMAIALAACSGSDDTVSTATTAADVTTTTAEATTTTAEATTTTAGPTFRILSEAELTAALLDVQDLPAGYSQDPPVEGGNKTFCDYEPPFTETIRVRQDFTKGGGLSAELLSTGLRQFATPDEAKAAFDALVGALETCTEETYEGTNLTYSPMSAPRVGDASVGVKINADGTDLLQFFALVGPTVVNTGGGGLMNASAEDVTALLGAQVSAYQEAATS